ncbi:unnamed protein product [Blepharisma stoltei]|uniref:Uncharacterized protein n=1 Tax=Blepharisma stoltei TaxID=1481888 RepID=A0AAU9K113_9CILI|nr:unnamed protein product [Blepharisma stoltei]
MHKKITFQLNLYSFRLYLCLKFSKATIRKIFLWVKNYFYWKILNFSIVFNCEIFIIIHFWWSIRFFSSLFF